MLPLKNQLACFLETTANIDEMIDYRFNRERSDDTVRDVFDGLMYQELSKPGGILSDRNNLSITLNTDGARVFRSGNYSLWPVMCRLNELPPEIRFNVENIFIVGIWFGKHPNMNVYLSQFALEARTLHSEGFQWTKSTGELVRSKVVTANACFDSVAICKVQCSCQFIAYFGCCYCVHPGYLVNLTNDVLVNRVDVVPENSDSSSSEIDFNEEETDVVDDVTGTVEQTLPAANPNKKIVKQVRYSFSRCVHEDRTDQQIRADMVEGESSGKIVRGIRGISPLIVLIKFNLVGGFVIDYMHAVLLGVTKQLLHLWLDSKFSSKNFSVRCRIDYIDKRLLGLKPPLKLSKRRYESLKNYSTFKANMLEPWLLFYGIPCLQDVLPDVYLRHFAVLVTCVHTLLLDCITLAELDNCHRLLLKFVEEFETLYGPSQMTYNVHLLTHLVTCARNWGPLWAYSAFGFESGNGMLLKLVSGSRGVMTQIARKYTTIRFLPKILSEFVLSDEVKNFCDEILIVAKSCKVAAKFTGVTLLGKSVFVPLTAEERDLIERSNIPGLNNSCYQRMILNGIKYHSEMYARQGKKTFDGGVVLSDKTFGTIRRIFLLNNRVFVIIRCIEIERNMPIVTHASTNAHVPHIKVCQLYPYGDLRLISATEVCGKCIVLKTDVGTLVTTFPNNFQKD